MPNTLRTAQTIATAVALLFCVSLRAQPLEIDIVGGQEAAQPIAVTPFHWIGESANKDLSRVVIEDLRRTGRFDVLSSGKLPALPGALDSVELAEWRQTDVEALLVGTTEENRDGTITVRCRLYQTFTGEVMDEFAYAGGMDDARQIGHRISNRVYKTLTGEEGVFETRLAYVKVALSGSATPVGRPSGYKRKYELIISDWDGENPSVIKRSTEPLLSPTWHPTGNRLAYVSYENGRAEIYGQDLRTGRRKLISTGRGLNNSPAYSPDGQRIAYVRSEGANVDIYIRDLKTNDVQRITRNPAIDTEPEWGVDGRSMLFTSDRGGKTQAFSVDLESLNARRITYRGKSNSRPRMSPNGRDAVVVHSGERGDQIALLMLDSNELEPITAGRLDDSPSFSPDGRFIAYAAENNVGSRIVITTVDGLSQWELPVKGDIREPVWGPR